MQSTTRSTRPSSLGSLTGRAASLLHPGFVMLLAVALPSAARGSVPPWLDHYRGQTAIAERPFQGPLPGLLSGSDPIQWSLVGAPPGMLINESTGEPSWESAVEGRYEIIISAANAYGEDQVEWILHVVANDIPDGRIVSTRYIDFVVPDDIATWMETWEAGPYVDAGWRQIRDVIGQEPLDGRQVVKYAPNMGGGAHSGNPVKAGPGWWSTDPVDGWTLGIWHHEVGHNFHGETRIGRIIEENWFDLFLHHGMELTQVALEARVLEQPERFGLSGEALVNYQAWAQSVHDSMFERSRHYKAFVDSGGRADEYVQLPDGERDTYGAWGWICRELCDGFGPELLETTLRAVRVDGLPSDLYDLADTPLKKNTLFLAIISAAADMDLRFYFWMWGFDVDYALYTRLVPEISQHLEQLPREDVLGWKRSPLTGFYYRLTPWWTDWNEAERMAQRWGGHLVTVRSQAENDWLLSRFGNKQPVWLGLTDLESDGLWQWSSGEDVSYTNWGPGEPNGGIWEYFGTLNWWGTDQWNDVDDHPRYYGLIEVEQHPAQGTCDVDESGLVDLADLMGLRHCLAGPEEPSPQPACMVFDSDGDADVDLRDFAGFSRLFSGS